MNVAASLVLAEGGESFHAPGPSIFDLPPVFSIGGVGVITEVELQCVPAFATASPCGQSSLRRTMLPRHPPL